MKNKILFVLALLFLQGALPCQKIVTWKNILILLRK